MMFPLFLPRRNLDVQTLYRDVITNAMLIINAEIKIEAIKIKILEEKEKLIIPTIELCLEGKKGKVEVFKEFLNKVDEKYKKELEELNKELDTLEEKRKKLVSEVDKY